jgi:crotonobetainyl-CoA:carnitine CoA-transferase CaiB-like acyl-CoA transferase
MGRPAHRPDPVTRRQVEAMAAYGVPETDIGRVLSIDPKTLRKHYRDELDTGAIKANSRMAENLYKKAMGDGPQAVSATIFWLKTRAQWRESPQAHEVAVSNEFSEMSKDDLVTYLNRTMQKMGYEPLRRVPRGKPGDRARVIEHLPITGVEREC